MRRLYNHLYSLREDMNTESFSKRHGYHQLSQTFQGHFTEIITKTKPRTE